MQTKNSCPQDQRFEVADIFRLYGDKYRNQNRLMVYMTKCSNTLNAFSGLQIISSPLYNPHR